MGESDQVRKRVKEMWVAVGIAVSRRVSGNKCGTESGEARVVDTEKPFSLCGHLMPEEQYSFLILICMVESPLCGLQPQSNSHLHRDNAALLFGDLTSLQRSYHAIHKCREMARDSDGHLVAHSGWAHYTN